MNNEWNRKIYKVWAPVYDVFFNQGMFIKARQKVFQDVVFKKEEKILFAGVGTGADLRYLPSFPVEVTAVDYSQEMLEKAKEKYVDQDIHFIQMDAQHLEFQEDMFDTIIASLILSVVPDPNQMIKEMARVLKPGGKIIIFDKFVPKDKGLSFGQKVVSPLIRLLGTDISVSFENLFQTIAGPCVVTKDNEVMMNGIYRHIVLEKKLHEV
ncbi:class I SAM-dependent methyltransferase [Fictibacillus sp. NRS-1165]|uniref:class I SAM-dependent methyltransferase n=1 Tax=Fictibacillus sp. NRS-1165 TaxID=3144463 RepID=UPI003D263D76